MSTRRRWTLRRSDRVVVGIVASLAVLVPIGWLWVSSLVPATYSVMDMGYPDYGGGPGYLALAMLLMRWPGLSGNQGTYRSQSSPARGRASPTSPSP